MKYFFSLDRLKFTRLDTGPATNAFLNIDDSRRLFLPCDCLHRARLLAKAAHLALFGIDPKFYETRADQGRASLLLDMGLIFISKIADRG